MITANGVSNDEFIEYKNRPLVRKGNEIIYGDLSESHHVLMTILAEAPKGDNVSVPVALVVQLIKKDDASIVKQGMIKGLKEALDTADAWLDRYNK